MPPSPDVEESLASIVSPALGKAAFRIDRSRPFAFICGGASNKALRHQFLKQAARPPRRIIPILAEQTFAHQLIEKNLQSFEQFLASAAECVLIFVESPGSFAETGLFAALKKVRKKTLIVNTRRNHGRSSFLNQGPIRLIRKTSEFDDNIVLARKQVTTSDANRIVKAILSTCTKYKNALVFHPEPKFTDLDLRLQLGCVYVTVSLIWAGAEHLVTTVLRKHFKGVESETVGMLLSLLKGINLLGRDDEIYFNPSAGRFDNTLIHSVEFSAVNLRAKTLEWQAEYNSQVAIFLREHLGVGI